VDDDSALFDWPLQALQMKQKDLNVIDASSKE
jgi:hypothetical protein